jgi:hypothetical protein
MNRYSTMPIFSKIVIRAPISYRRSGNTCNFAGTMSSYGIRHGDRGARKRIECLQRRSICCLSGRRLALAASDTCCSLDWHA